MKSKLKLRITTERSDILQKCLSDAVGGIEIEKTDNEVVIRLEESGRLMKNAHVLVTYANYILKTINELEEFNKELEQ
ncbi:hypothetical protein NEAUS05_0955 [Nematocida ausubeli]|nr:hypothetical protein NEAUS07_0857 [Nematocida ausubeli]KAI5147666.1 hypothetical protein NEAUS05_0955 [Nematocida ausubeli]